MDLDLRAKWQFELLLMSKDLQEEREDEVRDHVFYLPSGSWQSGRGNPRWECMTYDLEGVTQQCIEEGQRSDCIPWFFCDSICWVLCCNKECSFSLFHSPLPPHGYIGKQYQGELWQWISFVYLPCWEVERNYSFSGLIHDLKSSVFLVWCRLSLASEFNL